MTLTPEQRKTLEDASNFNDYVYPSKIKAAMDVLKEIFSNGIDAAMDVPQRKRFFSGGNKKKSKKFQKGGGGKFSEMWNRGSVSIKNDRVSRGLFDRLKGRSYLRTSSALSKIKQYIPDLPSRLRNIGRTYNPSAFLKLATDFLSKLPPVSDTRPVLERLKKIFQDPDNPKIPKDTLDEVQGLLNPNEPVERKIGGKRRTSKNKSFKGGEAVSIIIGIVGFISIMFAIYGFACYNRLKFVIVFEEDNPVFDEEDGDATRLEFLNFKKKDEAKCCWFSTFLLMVLCRVSLNLLLFSGWVVLLLGSIFDAIVRLFFFDTTGIKKLKEHLTDVGAEITENMNKNDELTRVEKRKASNNNDFGFGVGSSETD